MNTTENTNELKIEPNAEKLYDMSMIVQLCRDNEDQVKKMVTVFIEQVPQLISDVKSAYENRDFTALKKAAHKVKPTLSYYAIVILEKDIQQIEALAEEALVTTELDLKIGRLESVVAKVVENMKIEFGN